MSEVTKRISKYVIDNRVNLSELSRVTKISYQTLYNSLMNKGRERDLRDNELLAVCAFLNVDPMDFADETQK